MDSPTAEEVEDWEGASFEDESEEEEEDLPINMPTQEQALTAWATRIKADNSIYRKTEPCFARRALRAGTLTEAELEEGAEPVSYAAGDYVCYSVEVGLLVLSSEDFETVFDAKNPEPITEEGSEDWANQGFQQYASIEKAWAIELLEDDPSVTDSFPDRYFMGPEMDPQRVKPGAFLVLNYPGGDALTCLSRRKFEEAYFLETSLPPAPAAAGTPTPPPAPPAAAAAAAEEDEEAPADVSVSAKEEEKGELEVDGDTLQALRDELKIDDVELQALVKRFKAYDNDGTGNLDAAELSSLLQDLGEEYSADELREVLRHVDRDGNGTIDFEEFLRWWCGCETSATQGWEVVDTSKQTLANGVLLYRHKLTSRKTHLSAFEFFVELTLPRKRVDFTLDCTGSDNFAKGESDPSQEFHAQAAPFRKQSLGVLYQQDPYQGWSLSSRMSWTVKDDEHMKAYEAVAEARAAEEQYAMQATVQAQRQLAPSVDPIAAVADAISAEPKLERFVDVAFPPKLTSVAAADKADDTATAVVWRPAEEFLTNSQPAVFSAAEGGGAAIEPNDIRQGALGDCWFMCALAAMAEFPEQVRSLFITQEYQESGLYRVRFNKTGVWQHVTVDSYFPCYAEAGPVFSRGVGEELWVLLLEKAYAKLHGSYYALRGGLAREGLMDLTGCPFAYFQFDDSATAELIAKHEFFDRVLDWDRRNLPMCCSTPGEDKFSERTRPADQGGLVPGHAYTLTSAVRLDDGTCLVRVRNPWGSFEWGGDYSDNDARWTDDLRAEISAKTGIAPGKVAEEDDGMFWMPFDQLTSHFTSCAVCYARDSQGNLWNESHASAVLESSRADDNASCDAHFNFSLAEESEVIVTLHQEDSRIEGVDEPIDIAFTVLRKTAEDDGEVVSYGWLDTAREVSSVAAHESLVLAPGEYTVVPWSSGCRLSPVEPGASAGAPFSPEVATPVANMLFRRFATFGEGPMAGHVHGEQLEKLAAGAAPADVLAAAEQAGRPGLTQEGVLKWLCAHQDPWAVLEQHGFVYDADAGKIKSVDKRTVGVTVHSTSPVELRRVPFIEDVQLLAEQSVMKKHGEVTDYDAHELKIYKMSGGYSGTSFAVENTASDSVLEITMDCSGSNNTQSHTGNLKVVKVIEPNDVEVMHHLSPAEQHNPWGWTYSLSLMRKGA